MKLTISEKQLPLIQYKTISEQTENKLYQWFKSVPQAKLDKMFRGFYLKYVPDSPEWVRGILKNFAPEFNVSRSQILKMVSNPNIVVYVDETKYNQWVDALNKLNGSTTPLLGFYLNKISKTELEDFKSSIQQVKSLPNKTKEELQYLKYSELCYELFSKYSGRIVMSNNPQTYSNAGEKQSDVLSHERLHYLTDATKNKFKEIINGICDFKNCSQTSNPEYYSDPDEIYAFLMELRYTVGLKGNDVITKVEITEITDKFLLKIWVSRGGKTVQLFPKILFKRSHIYYMLKCCKTNMADGIKLLHNSLAKSDLQQNNTTMG